MRSSSADTWYKARSSRTSRATGAWVAMIAVISVLIWRWSSFTSASDQRTSSASSLSRSTSARPARSSADSTSAPRRNTLSFTVSSAFSNAARGRACALSPLLSTVISSPVVACSMPPSWSPQVASAEAAGDVVLGQLVRRAGEELLGRRDLDEVAGAVLAHGEERGVVARACRLLHVVGDDDDRVVLLELVHELLDPQRGD